MQKHFVTVWKWILQMGKAPKYGVSNYRKRTRRKIGRHKKNMSKSERLSYKPYVGQGR